MADIKKIEAPKKEAVKEKSPAAQKKRGPQGPHKHKALPKPDSLHVGKMIERKMKAQNLNKNKLAKILKLTPPTISQMINSNSIQTDRLFLLSETLKYNFFADIAQTINIGTATAKPADPASDARVTNLQGKVADLELELRFLKEENKYVKYILELMAGSKK